MLKIQSLSARLGDFELKDISMSLAPAECHALLGPSGSGKSTLLKTLLGVLKPSKGTVFLEGQDITHAPIEKRGLGYVPQSLGLFPHLTVRDNLHYSARARGLSEEKTEPLLTQLIETTRLRPLLDRFPATLSGGERQRVGLVRALASQPRLVLLDEPFAALNETLRRELWWMLRELQRERGLTVLLITHDLAEAYFLAERITVMLEGRVVQQGEKSQIYSRPAVPEVARFIGVETLQPGRVLREADGIATVAIGATQVLAVVTTPLLTTEVLVSIRGEEVTLQRHPVEGSSVRNHLRGRVTSVRPGSPLVCVELDVGFPLLAFVTRAAADELKLERDTEVIALIKAPSIHLIPRSGATVAPTLP